MDFLQFSQLLFDNQLLASEGTVREVYEKYQLAIQHTPEYVGLSKKVTMETEFNTKVFKGTDGTKYGLLPVKGALVYEETGWEALCGMTSYEGLQAKAERMINRDGVEHIILELNSGGGMAYGCFETAQYVKNLASQNDVKITAYVDGVAFSGGYAWCCIADEVIVNPMAKVGSIGVVLPLVNRSEQDKKEGIERIYITAGKSKVPFDKDGKFTKEAISDIQKDVMVTYEMFVQHVADMRGMSRDDVMDTEAKTFGTKDALKLGLIDDVMTKEQFYEHLGNFNGDTSMSITALQNKSKERVEGADAGTQVEGAESPVMINLVEQIKDLKADVQNKGTEITALTGQVTTLTTRNQELEKQLSEAKVAAEASTKEAREAKIAQFVAADDVAEHMEFVADFDKDKFDKYVARLEKEHEKVESSFEEQGQQAAADDDQPELSVEEKMLARIQARKQGK